MCISKHHIVHLKHTPVFLFNYTSIKIEKKRHYLYRELKSNPDVLYSVPNAFRLIDNSSGPLRKLFEIQIEGFWKVPRKQIHGRGKQQFCVRANLGKIKAVFFSLGAKCILLHTT